MKIVLGIETSCDETAAALVNEGRTVLSSTVASQMAIHRPFRGVVPELASRAHVERINQVIEQALQESGVEPDAIAVTSGPGLIGSLLVGAVTAETLAWIKGIPLIGVNHLEGHLFSGLVEHSNLRPPFLGLIVSGGHTELLVFKNYGKYKRLGGTRDDAAGEAFDKIANLLSLPFPGGPSIDRMAKQGRPDAVVFPRAWIPDTFDFSFSGLKTSVANYVKAHPNRGRKHIADICASFQESVVDVLVKKTFAAAKAHKLSQIVIGGGVAANSRLRTVFQKQAQVEGIQVFLPNLAFCTDNAAMIAAAGFFQLSHGMKRPLKIDPAAMVRSW